MRNRDPNHLFRSIDGCKRLHIRYGSRMPDAASLSPEVNMADVAKRAGVSIATVSRALREVPGVSPATRARIREIADELSYVVSPEASRLSKGRTGRVAVVVPTIDYWFYSAMLSSVDSVLRRAELDVLIYQVDGEEQRRRFFQDLPARRKVDAVILIALPVLQDEERRLDLLGVQVVVAGGRLREYPHVEGNDHQAATQAMQHLLDLGHRRIAMIRTSDTTGAAWSSDIERTRAFRESLRNAGLPWRDDYLETQPFGVRAGADGMAALLALPEPPTAVFAYSDEIAFSAWVHLTARGLRVPDDMSIVAVDGHPFAEVAGLTTVDQRVHLQGELAGEMALAIIRGEALDEPSLVVPAHLIQRASTAAPPDTRSRPSS